MVFTFRREGGQLEVRQIERVVQYLGLGLRTGEPLRTRLMRRIVNFRKFSLQKNNASIGGEIVKERRSRYKSSYNFQVGRFSKPWQLERKRHAPEECDILKKNIQTLINCPPVPILMKALVRKEVENKGCVYYRRRWLKIKGWKWPEKRFNLPMVSSMRSGTRGSL